MIGEYLEDTFSGIEGLANFYSEQTLKFSENIDQFILGDLIGYKKVKAPRYFKIIIPTISRYYDEDFCQFVGYLIRFKEIRLFKIGTEIVEVPVYKKREGKAIKFRRYSPIN